MTNLPASCAWAAASVRASFPHGSPADEPDSPTSPRLTGDRGEGVISTAIAVLILAFIGAAMWVAFNSIWRDSEARIRANVEQIGTTD
jgi:hypothetical protein